MMTNQIQKLRKRAKRGDAGAALVMVIIALAFIGMLVAMVVYMSYGNYLMKANDKRGKDNFYSAERVLNVINGHLQEESSKAMLNAYSKALQSATLGGTSQTANYQTAYIDTLFDAIKSPTSGQWNLDTIKGFAEAEGITIATTAGARGAFIEAGTGGNVLTKVPQESVTLKNLRIVYTDEQGYVSIIQTDIVMHTPPISFAAESKPLPVADFSLIANHNLYVDTGYTDSGASHGGPTKVEIGGDVYAGMEGLQVGNGSESDFVTYDASNPDVASNLIAGNLHVYNTNSNGGKLKIDDVYTTFAKDIVVDSGNLELNGISNIGDDLEIRGKDSSVKLMGTYNGYGSANNDANASSSILINGAGTKLDFSQLEKMVLSGYAFVGATKYDANIDRYRAVTADATVEDDLIENVDVYNKKLKELVEGGTTFPIYDPVTGEKITTTANKDLDATGSNSSDVLMGEAAAVKAEQLLYMVPVDCIGIRRDGTGQDYAKNPMTADDFKHLKTDLITNANWDDYKAIDTNAALTAEEKENAKNDWLNANLKYNVVNFENLVEKIPSMAVLNLGNTAYKAVYRRINGTVMVYLYIDFGTDFAKAERFYRNYYEYDPVGMEKYISSYISKSDFKWNNNLLKTVDGEKFANLTTNSSMFYYNNARKLMLQPNTTSESSKKQTDIYNLKMANERGFKGLLYLLDSSRIPVGAQLEKTLFENLVDESKIVTQEVYKYKIGGGEANGSATDPVGIITNTDYHYNAGVTDTVKVIISTKNIYLDKDFSGLAVAGGDIIVESGCDEINSDKLNVDTVLTHKPNATGEEMKMVFYGAQAGDDAGIHSGGSSEENKVILSDFIMYENWIKE